MNFSIEVHDKEAGVFALFLQLLHLVIVRKDHEDKLRWIYSKRGLFKVKFSFCSLVLKVVTFPRRVSGGPKLLQGWPFLCGQQL